MRKVIVCKAPLHQMIACPFDSLFILIDQNTDMRKAIIWHISSHIYYVVYVVDNNIYIDCVQDHFTTYTTN